MLIKVNLWILFQLLRIQIVSLSRSYPITTFLNAKWGMTPTYLEIAEFLHEDNPSNYWNFIENLKELTPTIELSKDEDQYKTSLGLAKKYIGPNQLGILKLSLSMRSLTPLIQAHIKIAAKMKPYDCNENSFVQIGNVIVCDIENLGLFISTHQNDAGYVELYEFDHVYPGSQNNSIAAVLYGQLGTKQFNLYHEKLKMLADRGTIKYIVRNYVDIKERKIRLSGYGVELHLKSTEYKSQDDSPRQADETVVNDAEIETEMEGVNFNILKQRYPHLSHSLERFKKDLMEKHETIEPLKAWEFQDLGLQAAEKVLEIQGEESLNILQYISQNFPTQAKSLVLVTVSEDLRNEMKHNVDLFARNLNLQPPDAALFLNGMFFDDTLDINMLLDTLKSESKILDGLHKIGIKGKSSVPILGLDLSTTSSKEFAIDIRDTGITWINDIENDSQYKRWSNSVLDLLRPTFPGMMRNVRKNLFNLVLVFNPIVPKARGILKLVESFITHSAPIRIGIVFDLENTNSISEAVHTGIMCAFNYVHQKKGPSDAMNFLTTMFNEIDDKNDVTLNDIKKFLKKKINKLSAEQINDILEEGSDFDYGRKLSSEFISRLGSKIMPQVLLNGVPIDQAALNSDDLEEAILSEIMQQTPKLQKAVYRGELDDSMEVINYLMSQPHVMPRLNDIILAHDNINYLDVSGVPCNNIEDVSALAQLSNTEMTATVLANIKYFGAQNVQLLNGNKLHFLTFWIVCDLNKNTGKQLLYNALKYLKENKGVRVAFIPNADNQHSLEKDNLNSLVWAAINTLDTESGARLVQELLETKNIGKIKIPENVKGFLPTTQLHLKLMRVYCQRVLNFGSSTNGLLINGRIVGPFNDNEIFGLEDFNLLEKFTSYLYLEKIKTSLKQFFNVNEENIDFNSDSLLQLITLLVPRQTTKTRYVLPEGLKEYRTVLNLEAKDQNQPAFQIQAVVDPASRGAQKLVPILILLRNIVNCNLKVYLCALEKQSDLPVKNFYRYVIEPELKFNADGRVSDGPIAKFVGLPSNSLLTQNLNVPENWLVEIVRSVYDLDNIKLGDINGPVHSEYELEYLLLEGHCFDSQSGTPPRGLQITLGTKSQPVIVDTIVMANLGYFQLKANPGVWILQLRNGKSSEIYEITAAEGTNTKHSANGTRVIISSLRSHVLKLRVTKKPGMQQADLLADDNDSSGGIWNSIANTITGGDQTQETINIFSVASGHLYERLLRIMMLSLLKHTKSPVKFWFLKNYLSPQFVDFLPHMAKHYKFEYEAVQYKWPRWLHQQTEKQRIIWGYKILFLDVLFPLDVKKIIFVDADQIVRADMKELYDLDLGGAPYGYTPFCDSRKEMEGFRFWKVGYWKNHLQGRKYHISALYVVDLKRFRKIAAGDRLRGQYQALSQDPNSLSNLDQDLPNNMIHQVAIKSLPQDWLWCETWCSSESLKSAKTIDLCNNPQTKEAKLTAAQRIVPEWKDYDIEIKNLMLKIEEEQHEEVHVRHSEGSEIKTNEHIEL